MEIIQLQAAQDNYIYILVCEETKMVGVVDPTEAKPVLDWLSDYGLELNCIFNTHHHHDHIGGNDVLQKKFPECEIVAPAAEYDKIPNIDLPVMEGHGVVLGSCRAQVIDVKGHTKGHVAYWFEKQNAVFCGDALFSLGCGRIFEGTPAEMWNSLKKLRSLPEETLIYCAHEYTENNAEFALTIETTNPLLQNYVTKIRKMRREKKPTIPSVLAIEKAINPFLRCDHLSLKKAVNMEDASDIEVFAEIRARKDRF